MINNFAIYLTKIMKDTKTTNKVLAEWITDNFRKIGQNSIAKYRDGSRTPPPDFISFVAEYFGVSEQFFFTGDNSPVKTIPVIGTASYSVPNSIYSNVVQHIPIPADISLDSVYAVIAVGESMLPKIADGDIIICDKEMKCKHGDIVHYTTIDGYSGLKKYLTGDHGAVTLMPINSDYPPIMCDEKDISYSRAFKIFADL